MLKLKLKNLIPVFAVILYFAGCSDNSVTPPASETLLFERAGQIDSLTGTCSAYIVHTHFLDTLDLSAYNNVKITLEGGTDGDLSNIDVFYVRDSLTNILSLEGLTINNTMSVTVPSPKVREFFQVRLKLNSSVCTGHIYHLKLRNLKIYGIN
jgi:hypothetical protein